MPRPIRFTTEQLEEQLNIIIELLIMESADIPEAERKDLKVEDVAKRLEVNCATLRRWCQAAFEVSPREYLARYRLNKAQILLAHGVKPFSAAMRLGFTEHKVFSTLFKRHLSMTPSEYALISTYKR